MSIEFQAVVFERILSDHACDDCGQLRFLPVVLLWCPLLLPLVEQLLRRERQLRVGFRSIGDVCRGDLLVIFEECDDSITPARSMK